MVISYLYIYYYVVLSPFAYPLLQQIPFSVIIGVFIYLAYASISGMQLQKRVKLLFMPPKHHPDIHYVRKVRLYNLQRLSVIRSNQLSMHTVPPPGQDMENESVHVNSSGFGCSAVWLEAVSCRDGVSSGHCATHPFEDVHCKVHLLQSRNGSCE